MYGIVCYFLLDVRANQSGGTWVPWSIDSFEKYTCVLYICIISSHIRINLLFSFGYSGEQAGGSWVPWSIDSFEKYPRVLYKIYASYHLMYAIICYFLLDVRGEPVRRYVSSLKYRFLWKIHLCTLYMHNIIIIFAINLLFSFWMFGRTSPAVREFPWSIDSFEKYPRVLL